MFGASNSYPSQLVPQLVDAYELSLRMKCVFDFDVGPPEEKDDARTQRTNAFTRKGFLSRRSRVQSVVSVRL
jgi:hypothetical protein